MLGKKVHRNQASFFMKFIKVDVVSIKDYMKTLYLEQ